MGRLIRAFVLDESGTEMEEFGLALAVFSIAALIGWTAIASAANNREQTTQNSLQNAAMNPP